MTYQVLARKYRPQNFQEIVGQEHVVQALVNGLENNRLHHAFLFTGTRGVGKTTLARVLAKALNCLEGVTGNPCGVCQHCQEIKNGEFIDLIEVDAASRTGVDDTRTLLENVQYAPNKGSYKIYLIDEVHMFSKSSFNALLKTLEEPPEHVKFLLATTEPDKLPVTVLSRCLQFNLKRLTQKQIGDHLVSLLEKESVQFDQQAIKLISRVADGSMRDALSLMDQSLAFGAGQVQYDEIRNMLGTIEQSHVTELLNLIVANQAAQVTEKLEWLHDMSVDYTQLLEDFCLLLHESSLIQTLGSVTGGSHFDMKMLKYFAGAATAESLQWYYQIVVLALEQIKYTPSKKISFEMAVIRMLAFEKKPMESETDDVSIAQNPEPVQNNKNTRDSVSEKAQSPATKSHPQDNHLAAENEPDDIAVVNHSNDQRDFVEKIDLTSLSRSSWPTVFKTMKLKGLARELARNLELVENQDNVITFAVDEAAKNFMTDKAQNSIVEELLAGSKEVKVNFKLNENSGVEKETVENTENKASEITNVDPVVVDLQQQFGATIIQNKLGE